MRKFSTALKIIVSAAILLFLLNRANLSDSLQHLSQIRTPFLLLSIILIILGQILRAQRLTVMLFGKLGSHELWRTLRIQMVSFLPGVVSPAKVGEVAKVYMLQEEMDVPAERGLVCFMMERALDLALLGPLAAASLYIFIRAGLQIEIASNWKLLLLLGIAAIAGVLVIGVLWIRRRGISTGDLWRTASPKSIIKAAVLTLFYWTVVFLEVWCFCKAATFDAQLWHMALVIPPALISSMIPISFAGFGLREAAMVILLQRPLIGSNYEQALLVSIMYDIIGLGVPAIMGVLYWMLGKRNGDS